MDKVESKQLQYLHGRAAASLKAEVREAMENAENVGAYCAIIWFVEETTGRPSIAVVEQAPAEGSPYTVVHALGDLLATIANLSREYGIPPQLVQARAEATRDVVGVVPAEW